MFTKTEVNKEKTSMVTKLVERLYIVVDIVIIAFSDSGLEFHVV